MRTQIQVPYIHIFVWSFPQFSLAFPFSIPFCSTFCFFVILFKNPIHHINIIQVVPIGAPLATVAVGQAGAASAPAPKAAAPTPAPAAAPAAAPKAAAAAAPAPAAAAPKAAAPAAPKAVEAPKAVPGSRTERRVPMTRLRQTVAKRLKDSQNTYASLTTFNEIDMTNAINVC
jgi:2-oxoglutarate dehydrogenase E2 component (dihydrolipoamide succinyltransferase)